MFTGLIEVTGGIVMVEARGSGRRLRVGTSLAAELAAGDSIAVNGVCLTVAGLTSDWFEADVSPETLRVTTLGGFEAGRPVNLERPLRADARLGGHFVLGHVDGVGRIETITADGDNYWIEIAAPAAVSRFLISKGSVAVDGISLTVARLDDGRFGVQIVPYTWAHTALAMARTGDIVNLEADVLGKYVARLMGEGQPAVAGSRLGL